MAIILFKYKDISSSTVAAGFYPSCAYDERKPREKTRKSDLFEDIMAFFKGLNRRVKVAIAGSGIQNWSQSLSLQYNQRAR
jgi:hypothetical protein